VKALENLISDLMSATNKEILKWQETIQYGSQPTTFHVYMGANDEYKVEVSVSFDDDREINIASAVLYRGNEVLDVVSYRDFEPNYGECRELYDTARRSAKGVKNAINEIQNFLRGKR